MSDQANIYVEYCDGSVNKFSCADEDPVGSPVEKGFDFEIRGTASSMLWSYRSMESALRGEGSVWSEEAPRPWFYEYAIPETHTVGTEFDPVARPAHYTEGRDIEPINVILDWELDFLDGQVVKYCSRAGRKGDALEDYRKAEFYLKKKIEQLEEEE